MLQTKSKWDFITSYHHIQLILYQDIPTNLYMINTISVYAKSARRVPHKTHLQFVHLMTERIVYQLFVLVIVRYRDEYQLWCISWSISIQCMFCFSILPHYMISNSIGSNDWMQFIHLMIVCQKIDSDCITFLNAVLTMMYRLEEYIWI